MGRALVSAIQINEQVQLTAAITKPGDSLIGSKVEVLSTVSMNSNVLITDDLVEVLDQFDVLIDFTRPHLTLQNLKICQQANKALVIGTTGFTAEEKHELEQISQSMPVVFSANYSVGVNLCLQLMHLAARVIGEEADIEIIEGHHKHKVDAPSGTALHMGKVIANSLGQSLDDVAVYDRSKEKGARKPNSIGFATVRAGSIVGDHTAVFALENEIIEIKHKASSRMTFADGAVRAAQWIYSKPSGLYSMQDVLDLNR
ncbi:UNVERIFIED_CONTAM: hypothetical protein GTU68_056375 [Idotea baltica]|nr:hypothetical protein [Idotea baltica]